MNKIECPKCGQIDSIQKISSIVSSGTSSGTYSGPTGGVTLMDDDIGFVGGFSTLSGTSKSELARMLTPPPKPKKQGGFNTIIWMLIITSGIIGIYLLGFVFSWINDPVLGIISISCLAFTIWAIRENNIRKSKGEKQYSEDKKAWDRAIHNWDKYFYCFRDDIVFDPESGKSCPPNQLYVL